MRTREKIRIANAFKRGESLCGCLVKFPFVCRSTDVEDAIRWALNQSTSNDPASL